MMADPTISIITVVRNAAAALAETIASVRAQTYPRIEYVVVDGASTDGTVDVLRANEARLDKWVSEPDRGLYDAMNKGKSMAAGDFALFVNAGDVFVDDTAIARVVASMRSADTLYFGSVRITDSSGRLSWDVPMLGDRRVPPASYLPHHQSAFYPRRFYAHQDYDPAMGYRSDAHYTGRACRALEREFVDVTLIKSTLGGISSRAITTLAELRKEIKLETALARHVAASTGNHLQLLDVTLGAILKYFASKIGGPSLVHRLMYMKHVMRHWATSLRSR